MPELKPDDEPAQQHLNAQALLELRDLQNAQINSMKHVWDNPYDDCRNDVPLEKPPVPAPTPREYFETCPYRTNVQLDLFDRMSEISEEALCPGWTAKLYDAWLQPNTPNTPIDALATLHRALLRQVAKALGAGAPDLGFMPASAIASTSANHANFERWSQLATRYQS